ncbi:hypothetical protein NCC78_19515 [Micromonospora phytophila]|uniref:N,N-dimethylformamidase beta subunit family domain-containing protein n=1 Tax=Micromonospora phytophila TaxID=709888 RepID=UPI00202DD976|nr:N,N-dimethylformamidase beta subunit family domain-containing protein [Micromonospora phytophila]MCM0676857.1 hypothetical protein [Micromonospora phytophila]
MDEGTAKPTRRTALTVLGAVGAAGAAGLVGLRVATGSAPGTLAPVDAAVRPVAPAPGATRPVGGVSPTVAENARPGDAGFRLDGLRHSTDHEGQIAGYASATSVAPGETLDFFVSVAPAQGYRITVFRVGHYGGAGARQVVTSPWLDGVRQDPPQVSPTDGAVWCSWQPGWRLTIDAGWVSGLHLALLRNAQGYHHWIPFVVADPSRHADALVVVPTSTYQAYNGWPMDGRTGASLYRGYDAQGNLRGSDLRARAVSHDRPMTGSGLRRPMKDDIGFVQWIEQQGRDLVYASSEDLHSGRVVPHHHRAVIFPGHDEYWSPAMRAAVTTARDRGTSLVFLGANNCYWRIRYAQGDRLVECAKSIVPGPGPEPPTTRWRDVGDPEQLLIGAQYVAIVDGAAPLVVRGSDHWFWAGTQVRDGDEIPGVVHGEADQLMRGVARPASTESVLLSDSPFNRQGRTRRQQTCLYRAPSGAWVFAAGSLAWTRQLRNGPAADDRLRRATRNLLDRVSQAPPTVSG